MNLIHAKRLIFLITNYLNVENFIKIFNFKDFSKFIIKLNNAFHELINDNNVINVQ